MTYDETTKAEMVELLRLAADMLTGCPDDEDADAVADKLLDAAHRLESGAR